MLKIRIMSIQLEQNTTSHILMVRPANFGFNEQTAEDNAFQQRDNDLSTLEVKTKAVKEFDDFVQLLRLSGVDVIVIEDTNTPHKTDAVFPNNWITFHSDGTVITYPIYAPIRRRERREDVIEQLGKRFSVEKRIHLEGAEERDLFLEGTGSMILDRVHKVAYACRSKRTDQEVFDEFCKLMAYEKLIFDAVDNNGQEIYHTNVMMALGETFVVICLETITDAAERQQLLEKFAETNKVVVEITMNQLLSFAGNMLQVRSRSGEPILAMSQRAYESLTKDQIRLLNQHTNLLYSPLETIETYGGGSARCMMAEVFLPEKG